MDKKSPPPEATEASSLQCPSFCSRTVTRVLFAIGCAVVVAAVVIFGCEWETPTAVRRNGTEPEEGGADETPPADHLVHLPPEKIAAAGIRVAKIAPRDLRFTQEIAGKLEYAASRVLDLSVPVAGTVKEVRVAPGQRVREGDALAILASVEIGRARDEVRQRQAELEAARVRHDWVVEVAENVAELVAYLPDRPEMESVEERFAERKLGEHRESVLSAYSKLLLAEQMIEDTAGLADEGIVSTRAMQERQSNLEVARAVFRSAVEQADRGAALDRTEAEAELARAERLLAVSREHLAALLGHPAETASLEGDGHLNDFALRAPFDGRIEQQHAIAPMPFSANEPLFRFANTDLLWASAQIHDRSWSALSVDTGESVVVTAPALPDQEFSARVKFVGGAVSAENRTIPLVAELENAGHVLRPGMFVWVAVPVETHRTSLAVPSAALLRHEERTFVFTAEDAQTFRPVDVQIGLESPDWVEIQNGLVPGQSVVVQGAFYLKSELLLESEE
jgi:RND family efflux transporter MFP subunit